MKQYVLKSKVHGLDAYYSFTSRVNGLPINDDLQGARKLRRSEALFLMSRFNYIMRSWPGFTEDWLYKLVELN